MYIFCIVTVVREEESLKSTALHRSPFFYWNLFHRGFLRHIDGSVRRNKKGNTVDALRLNAGVEMHFIQYWLKLKLPFVMCQPGWVLTFSKELCWL